MLSLSELLAISILKLLDNKSYMNLEKVNPTVYFALDVQSPFTVRSLGLIADVLAFQTQVPLVPFHLLKAWLYCR